ncbi:MAG TPA: hypothetical protein VMR59_01310 [Patescibacteria group bacterium]|jgi:hypothetical protein|nr:hypothetical protein [Patescibacteria group bacterium]
MKKAIFILAAVLLFVVSTSSVEARTSSFKIKSYTPKIKTYAPKITIPKITTLKNYKSGGSLYLQKGYVKKNGTYVQPYLKTKADNTIYNNRKYILGY